MQNVTVCERIHPDKQKCSFILSGTHYDDTNVCTGAMAKGIGACAGDFHGRLIRKGQNGLVVP